jgi:GT2 family glycosyltransferase
VAERCHEPQPAKTDSTVESPSTAPSVPESVGVDQYSEWTVPDDPVTATVVVVTYHVDEPALRRTLDHLERQTADTFEVLVVDNGTDWNLHAELADRRRVRAYVRLDENYGVTTARNTGAHLARGRLLLFLDDDAIPAETFVEEHRRLHRDRDVVAARGRVLPRNDTIYNRLQSHYDLGPRARPSVLNIEGNTSFDRETFLSYDGYDADLDGRAGHEGLELTYRMVVEGAVDRDQIVYDPAAVVYHDYASDLVEFLTKRADRPAKATQVGQKHDRLFEFARTYERTDATPNLTTVDYLRLGLLGAAVRIVRRLPGSG